MAEKGDKGARRAVIRLELDVAAKQALDDLCELRGMTQIAVLSRLVKWFAVQDEVLQAAVLDLLSERRLGELAGALLELDGGGRDKAGRGAAR